MFNSVGAVAGPIASGKVKLIAIGAGKRSPGMPQTPTVKESGLPDFEASTWIGLYGPANLPMPIVDRISKEMIAILKQPDVRDRLVKMGMDVSSGTPDELAQSLERDLKLWGKTVREGNIQAEPWPRASSISVRVISCCGSPSRSITEKWWSSGLSKTRASWPREAHLRQNDSACAI
jgi:hypothetical protein